MYRVFLMQQESIKKRENYFINTMVEFFESARGHYTGSNKIKKKTTCRNKVMYAWYDFDGLKNKLSGCPKNFFRFIRK